MAKWCNYVHSYTSGTQDVSAALFHEPVPRHLLLGTKLNFQPRIMHFQRSDWFTQSRLSAHILQFDLIWTTTKFLSDKAMEKIESVSFLPTKQQKKKLNRKCHNSMGKKATNFGLQLFNGTPKFPYKFKEIISLRYSSVTTTKTTTATTTKFTLNIFRMACKPFQAESFQTIRRFFACLKNSLHLLTLSQVHNGP